MKIKGVCKMKKIALLSLVASSVLMASGYQIPESSINSTALADAYVANANGADAAYYNPANMVFSNNKGGAIEIDATYIGLSAVDYKGNTVVQTGPTTYVPIATNTSSKSESFFVPTLHYVSPSVGNWRFGLSIVSPAGLSKRWAQFPASAYSQEFTLKTVEVNPTVAYEINEQLAIAVGIRGVYSSGIVDNGLYSLSGTGFDWGYNLALTLKPSKSTNVALTYRSNVGLRLSGDTSVTKTTINSGVNVSVPIPAVIRMAVSHTFETQTTVEAVYEHDIWSAYENLDFNFNNSVNETNLGQSRPKNWKDTDVLRLGITQQIDKFTAMAGFAYDPTPAPNATLGYELPDADGKIISLGARYAINDQLSVGLAGLISFKDNRSVNNSVLQGEFSNSRAYLVTTGIEYKF